MITTTTFLNWLFAESETFTMLCATEPGETFTRFDVLKAHLYIAAVLLILFIVGGLE